MVASSGVMVYTEALGVSLLRFKTVSLFKRPTPYYPIPQLPQENLQLQNLLYLTRGLLPTTTYQDWILSLKGLYIRKHCPTEVNTTRLHSISHKLFLRLSLCKKEVFYHRLQDLFKEPQLPGGQYTINTNCKPEL